MTVNPAYRRPPDSQGFNEKHKEYREICSLYRLKSCWTGRCVAELVCQWHSITSDKAAVLDNNSVSLSHTGGPV